MIKFRELRSNDRALLQQIESESTLWRQSYPAINIKWLSSIIASPPYRVFVLEENTDVLAFCILELLVDHADLIFVYVFPLSRNKSYGRKLLHESFLELKKISSDLEKVFIEVRSSNAAAIALYQSLGWNIHQTRKTYYQDGEDALVGAVTI